VVAWGYDTTFAEIVDLETAPPQTQTPSWSIAGTTLVREPGVKLDLGGIAKGWSVDLAVERGLAHVVSAGGDVRSSLSTASVDVIDPWGQTPARFHLGTGGLATSSVSKRRWRAGDVTAHHLIDPRTGDPAESPVLSATAMCPTAVESAAAAKATLLQGVDGLSWADDQPWIEAVMVVWADGSVFATTGWEVAA
jgi:thiamine biosynthesis lipoprotein